MATLLAVYTDQQCLSTCDARCYDVKLPLRARALKRVCICGGANRGVGEGQARENVRAGIGRTNADLTLWATRYGYDPADLVVIDRTRVEKWKRARALADDALWMRRNQLELPFEGP